MQPDPTGADADLEAARLQAIRDNAARLGLIWELRPALVVGTISTNRASVIVDGDTDPIDVTSMIGAVRPGDRVYVIKSPPSGNHIVGFCGASSGPATLRSLVGSNVSANGILATSTGSEVAVLSTDYFEESIYRFEPGYVFRATLVLGVFSTDGADGSTIVRLRQGQQSTSGTQLCYWQVPFSSRANARVESQTLIGYFINTTDGPVFDRLSITNDLELGAHSALFGDGNIPLLLEITPIGLVAESAISFFLPSV